MNKFDKEKSREIRDIMRTDKWGRMTYKEARREWRKGTRVVWFSPEGPWMAFDNNRLCLSHKKLREFALVHTKILKYTNERCLEVEWEHEPFRHALILRVSGRAFNGKRFGYRQLVDIFDCIRSECPSEYLASMIIDRLDHELHKYGFYPPKYTPIPTQIYPLVDIHRDPRGLRNISIRDEWTLDTKPISRELLDAYTVRPRYRDVYEHKEAR